MQRRDFMLTTARFAGVAGVAGIGISGLALSGCSTTASGTTTDNTRDDPARRRVDIDADVDATMPRLYSAAPGSRELVAKASGMLVFPSVIAAGFGIGGQYGEGALRVHSASAGYYSIASISVGLQIGAQSKAIIFLFMTHDALDKFRKTDGWAGGVDASVAVLKAGVNGNIDVSAATGPVVAFVLTNTGLMANLTLEGTKVTRLKL